MGSLANLTVTLASAVADDAAVSVSYPTGATQASLIGSTGGAVVVNNDASYAQGEDPGVLFAFGATTITITNKSGVSWAAGSDLTASFGSGPRNGSYNLTLGTDADQAAAGDPGDIQELTASGAVAAGVRILDLNHATVVVAATIANLANHPGLFIVRDTSASGTAAHTVTLAAGTWDGTNDVITLNAPGEALTVYVDKNGRGQIIENTGAVVLS